MAHQDIIGIVNDQARNIRYYVIYLNAVMSRMLQAIGQYSCVSTNDYHLYLK